MPPDPSPPADAGRFRTLLEHLPGMAYRCRHDADWTLEYASAGSTALLGYTPDELVRDRVVSIAALIHPDDLEAVSLGVERAVAQRAPFDLTYRIRHRDGRERWIWEQGAGLFDATGRLAALEGFLFDATDRVRAIEALRDARHDAALIRLAQGVAHDVNNLLTVIQACVADCSSSDATTRTAARAAVGDAVRQGADLTQQLLAFARRGPVALQVSDLTRLLAKSEHLLTRVAQPTPITFHLPARPLWVHLDPSGFVQAMTNLIANARNALEGRPGVVTVRAGLIDEDGAPRVWVEVADPGPGIPPDLRDRIWEPFVSTRQHCGGTGLGLAVVHGTVMQSGGRIDLESAPEIGTRIRLSWPHHQQPKPRAPVSRPGASATLAGTVILVVDDEPVIRALLQRTLQLEGCDVLTAVDGDDALAVLERHRGRVDAMVTDAAMPRLDGIALASRVRATRPDLPLVLLTGHAIDAPPELFAAVLQKPADGSTVVAAVAAALAARG